MKSVYSKLSGRAKFALGSVALGLLCVALPSAASSNAPDRKIHRYEVKVPNAEFDAGAAKTNVQAPSAVLRSVVTDFAKYSKIISKFEKARVVGRAGERTDVYLQVPLMKGAAKIWAVLRFDQPQKNADKEVIRAKMVKGNLKRLDAVWRIREVDEKTSALELELLIIPDMPIPRSLVMSEARSAAAKAVLDTRKEAEQRARASK